MERQRDTESDRYRDKERQIQRNIIRDRERKTARDRETERGKSEQTLSQFCTTTTCSSPLEIRLDLFSSLMDAVSPCCTGTNLSVTAPESVPVT